MAPPWPRAGVVGWAASPTSVARLQPHVSPGSITLLGATQRLNLCTEYNFSSTGLC